MNKQVKSSQRKGRRKVNKCIFEVEDTNKQKLSKVEREKKGEKQGIQGHFHTREEREIEENSIVITSIVKVFYVSSSLLCFVCELTC